MIQYIDNFYSTNDLGLQVVCFLNMHFDATHTSASNWYGGDRIKAYPCYETRPLNQDGPYSIFKNTFETKTNLSILHCDTFFRKSKLEELKKSPSWGQCRPHQDDNIYDIAGVVYYNSNSLKDGTYIFDSQHSFEPTVIVGSKFNRCVFYDPKMPHAPSPEQEVEERWTQPFFIIHKQETFERFKKAQS
tara:strand:- start:38 stop:604 length:567 start_codon:yes stop_codon:yes gene_type:complete